MSTLNLIKFKSLCASDICAKILDACMEFLVMLGGFRCPDLVTFFLLKSTLQNLFKAAHEFKESQRHSSVRWKARQRESKASIQAKASGIHHHRGILTTIRSSLFF